MCPVLESNLRLTHLLPLGEERETRFRLLWICSVVIIFCSLPSLRGLVYFAEDLVFMAHCSLFGDVVFFMSLRIHPVL